MARIIDPKKVKQAAQSIDSKEMKDREEAADAYAGESPQHFVDYVQECHKEWYDSTEELRRAQGKSWEAYSNEIDYSDKEPWQSKAVITKPFQTVKGAIAVIRKAFVNPSYYTIEGFRIPGGLDVGKIVKKALNLFLDEQHANFPITFCDATEMSLVTGQSMEMIPSWEKGKGLVIDLVHPLQIDRDPEARSRDPWSGNFWIHNEWLDKWVLEEGETKGIYENIGKLKESGAGSTKGMDHDKLEKRKQMYWTRSRFRKSVLVSEFYGVVLDPKGHLLLPNCHFTVAGGEVIRLPKDSPFVRMRWPGTSFSPFPHLLRYTGRGLIEGVLSIWWILCNLLNLHMDNLNWAINKIREVDPSVATDPRDVGIIYPGIMIQKKPGTAEKPCVKIIDDKSVTPEVLMNLNMLNSTYDDAAFVNTWTLGQAPQKKVTKGEAQIRSAGALNIMDSLAQDIETGACNCLMSVIETIILNWTVNEEPKIAEVFGVEHAKEAMQFAAMDMEARKELLRSNCKIKVSGISAQLQRTEMMEKLQVFTRLVAMPQNARYIKWKKLLNKNAEALNEPEPDFIVSDKEAEVIDQKMAEQEKLKALMGMGGGPAAGGAPPPIKQKPIKKKPALPAMAPIGGRAIG